MGMYYLLLKFNKFQYLENRYKQPPLILELWISPQGAPMSPCQQHCWASESSSQAPLGHWPYSASHLSLQLLAVGTLCWNGYMLLCHAHICGFISQGCVPGHLVLSDSLQPHGLKPNRLLCPWNFPGKNTGMVVISYSRGPFQPRDQTCVSCISRRILYPWATWEALWYQGLTLI